MVLREVRKRLLPIKLGVRGGLPRELPTASSLVVVMSIKELRSFCQVPADISLELSDEAVVSTVRRVDNVVYFTWE